jgi:hypothetical protein
MVSRSPRQGTGELVEGKVSRSGCRPRRSSRALTFSAECDGDHGRVPETRKAGGNRDAASATTPPVLVTIAGSTWGGSMLKVRFIGRGMISAHIPKTNIRKKRM